MSEKVYGIGEDSKSAYEVPKAEDVYTKSETYSKSQTYAKWETMSEQEMRAALMWKNEGAFKRHASPTDTNGLGTESEYGHVKLVRSLSAPSGDQDGLALAASVGYLLKTYIDDAIAALQPVPVHGVIQTDTQYEAAEIRTMYGYGTWAYMGVISLSGVYVYFYKRTA